MGNTTIMATSVIKSWADAEDEIPAAEVINNPDGTKTVINYRMNANGQKIRHIQKIREVKVKEKVHPLIAMRKNWSKYGKEKDMPAGPDARTTQLGEVVELKLGTSWKEIEKEEEEQKAEQTQQIVSNQRIKCRTCGGNHFTSKCPFKDTLISDSANTSAAATPEPDTDASGKYVPPSLRKGAGAVRDMSGRDRDDSTTLKISQLNTFVDEDMLRNELLKRFHPLQRVTIVRNRETGESRGFAYVSFVTERQAEEALNTLNGKGYHSLILHLEWPKKRKAN